MLDFFKKWCLNTNRSGGVLVGKSIREFLTALEEHLKTKNE